MTIINTNLEGTYHYFVHDLVISYSLMQRQAEGDVANVPIRSELPALEMRQVKK
jgi:hypothetical protein